MKESKWMCFAVCVFAISVVVVLMLISWKPPQDSAQLAAWVQAFGSVLAIFGSAFIAFKTVDRSHRLERYRSSESALAIAKALENEGRKVLGSFGTSYTSCFVNVSLVYNRSYFESLVVSLERIPIHELPREDLVSGLIDLQKRWRFFLFYMDRFCGGVRNANGFKEVMDAQEAGGKLDEAEWDRHADRFLTQTTDQVRRALEEADSFEKLINASAR